MAMEFDEIIPTDVRSTLDAMGKKKKEGYGLGGRLVFFVIVVAVIAGISAAIFVPFAMGASMSAGGGAAGSPLALIPILAVLAIAASAFFIFKK